MLAEDSLPNSVHLRRIEDVNCLPLVPSGKSYARLSQAEVPEEISPDPEISI
jgi:hypothetical protein